LGVDPCVPLGRFSGDRADGLLVAVTEMNAPEDLEAYLAAARTVLSEEGT
jgi:hypothetical protein